MKLKLCILILMAGLPYGLLKADTLNYTVNSGGGAGQQFYQFTLTNSGTTGGPLFDLFLALPTDISNVNTGTIGKPTGWGDKSGGLLFFGPDVSPSTSFIEWTADFSGAYDLATGSTLTGFSFTTLERINGPITFALNDSTAFATAVQGAAGVPEPATFVMLLLATAVLGVCHRLKSARARSSQSKRNQFLKHSFD
jgi:hypothetical protein